MKRTPLSLIAHWAGGELHGQDVAVDAIAHDTRALSSGSLYLALRGERFDGHDFAADALARGAVALLVERLLDLDAPQVLVESSELALARIAAGMQRGRDAKVVAITGSNGKTSVKTLVLSVLRQAGHAYANPGNRNNEIGLPLAVIDAPEDADFAIYEMGAGKPGDIAYLTDVARPDVSVVNNIAPAHLERMGDLLGVATTKGAIYAALPAGGTAVVNADDAFGAWFEQQVVRAAETGRRLLRFGLDASAEVTAREVQVGADGSRFVLATPQGEAASSWRCRAATTCATRWPPPRSAWPAACRWRPSPRAWHRRVRSPAARSRTACRAGWCWWTTATTPIPARWPRRSMPWPPAATRPGWCWATCANWARRPRRCTPTPACARARPGSPGCTRWAN